MDKKIGETFEYDGRIYEVIEDVDDLLCDICHFNSDKYSCEYVNREVCNCDRNDRYDSKDVVFIKKEEK
ncbi:MAG: hypothetical protein ACRCXT_04400 [Paraclostridium sp.]